MYNGQQVMDKEINDNKNNKLKFYNLFCRLFFRMGCGARRYFFSYKGMTSTPASRFLLWEWETRAALFYFFWGVYSVPL